MNVFEFAMQMEKDGEAFYRDIAGKTKNAGLKKIFNTLADEEVVHYNTFKKLHEKSTVQATESNIFEKAKNIFVELKDAGGLDMSVELPQTEAYEKRRKQKSRPTPSMSRKLKSVIIPQKSRYYSPLPRKSGGIIGCEKTLSNLFPDRNNGSKMRSM